MARRRRNPRRADMPRFRGTNPTGLPSPARTRSSTPPPTASVALPAPAALLLSVSGRLPASVPRMPPPELHAEALLAPAKARRRAAREDFKQRTRLRAPPSRGGRVTKEGKLQKNRDSAAAKRHADQVYRAALEGAVAECEKRQESLALAGAQSRARRDVLAEEVQALRDRLAALRGEPPEDPEDECDTLKLLESTRHIPELRMTPAAFALSLMGPVACPAL